MPSRYPPAEPGAFFCEPLEAALGVANAAPIELRHLEGGKVISRGSSGRSADPPSLGCGYIPFEWLRLSNSSIQSLLVRALGGSRQGVSE